MKKYTKTIAVQAVHWTGENIDEMNALAGEFGKVDSRGWLTFMYTESIPPQGWLVVKGNHEDAWHETDEDFQRDYKEVIP